MTTATAPLPSKRIPETVARETVADLLHRLGDIPPDRVRSLPPPGTATLEDLIAVNERKDGPICEWIDRTLVEKPVGMFESWVTFIILGHLDRHLLTHDIGMVLAPDGVMRILPGIGRAPDIAFLRWAGLPGGKPPPQSDAVPEVVPDLAVEVLSKSNTAAEMARKRDEYFRAGVKLVWEIDPVSESAKVYAGSNTFVAIPPGGTLDGSDVLPGFLLSLKEVFDRASRR